MDYFPYYYDILSISWKTKENSEPIPTKSLWIRSGTCFVIIITRTALRILTAIGSFAISNIPALKSIRGIWAKPKLTPIRATLQPSGRSSPALIFFDRINRIYKILFSFTTRDGNDPFQVRRDVFARVLGQI